MIDDFITGLRTDIYLRLIERGKLRGDKRPGSGYERHHIVPESFYRSASPTGWLDGDPDLPENLVYLTCREHYIAHRLLKRMTTGIGRSKMRLALHRLLDKMHASGQRGRITSRVYQKIRADAVVAQKELYATPEMKFIMSSAQKEYGNRPEVRDKRSAIAKEVQSRPEVSSKKSASIKKALSRPDIKAKQCVVNKEVQNRPEVKARRSAISTEINAMNMLIKMNNQLEQEINSLSVQGDIDAEKDKLKTDLKEMLDSLTYNKLIETKAGEIDNLQKILKSIPIPMGRVITIG
jgi:hypothetical protein